MAEQKKMGRPIEWTDERLECLGQELIQYIKEHEDCFHISEFEEHKGRYPYWLRQIAKTHDFSRFIERGRHILGRRILKASMSDQKPHGWVVANIMPQYLSDIQEGRLAVLDKEEGIKHSYKMKEASQADERADRIIDALERNTSAKDS